MLRLLTRRVVNSALLLFVVSALSFVLVSITPGDAAREILGAQAPPQEYTALRHALGLDQPVYDQYWHWLRRAVHGDFGRSLFSGESVRREILLRLPVTLSLIGGALLATILVGIGLGVISAWFNGARARVVDAFVLVGFALPAFWLGAELIVLFAVKWPLFPATGYVAFTQQPLEWSRSLVLPWAALALGGVAVVTKQTRESMLDVLASEHIRMAMANGVPMRSLIFRHALRNAALPVVAVLGVQAVSLLGGTVLIETVFALPGLGSLAVNATLQHDLPVVEGIAVVFTLIVVSVNFAIDVLYGWLNPRVRIV